jgi:hypothetical protein
LGTTKKVYIKLLQIDLPPGQGGIVRAVFKFNQNKVKPPPAKWAEEIGSKAIESLFLPFFPQENGFTVFLPGHYPISQRVGRTAAGEKGLD